MNIGIVTTWFERGAAIVSRAYMNTLSKKGSVYIYARGGEKYAIGDPDWDNEYVTWGKRIPDSIRSVDWLDFKKWVSKYNLGVVIFNEEHDWYLIQRCLKLDILIGAYVDYYTKETVSFFSLYDFLLCNTQRHYSVFQSHPQAFFIPWGTDCNLYKPTMAINSEAVRFFHSAGMGGAGLRKGTDILVRAFQKVTGKTKLIIHSQVGIENYGEIACQIQNDPRITFIHKTVKAPGLYHFGDVYVYPTRLEGIGLTIAEALAAGLPVITTNSAPMSEFVQEGITGRLVRVENYREREDKYYWPESICSESALTNAMQFYVDNPQELLHQGHQARAYAIQYLDWEKNSADLSNFLLSVNKLMPKPKSLEMAVAHYQRNSASTWHISKAFEYHFAGKPSHIRLHLAKGVLYNPAWLLNRGVWSIGVETFLGKRAEQVRKFMGKIAR